MKKKRSLNYQNNREEMDYLTAYRELNKQRRLFEGEIDEVCYREQLKDFCYTHYHDFVDVNRWGEPVVKVIDI